MKKKKRRKKVFFEDFKKVEFYVGMGFGVAFSTILFGFLVCSCRICDKKREKARVDELTMQIIGVET